jgi:hypothetical protein
MAGNENFYLTIIAKNCRFSRAKRDNINIDLTEELNII